MTRPVPYTSVMINPANDFEVQHWARDMQVEPYELRAAIRLVGTRLSDVRRYFGKSAQVVFLENKRTPPPVSPTATGIAVPVLGTFDSRLRSIRGDTED